MRAEDFAVRLAVELGLARQRLIRQGVPLTELRGELAWDGKLLRVVIDRDGGTDIGEVIKR